MKFLVLAILPLITFTLPARAGDNAAPVMPDFMISYWWGPPPQFTTRERYQEIKDANFTVALPIAGGAASVEQNLKMLDHCQSVGLKAVIWDRRIAHAIN